MIDQTKGVAPQTSPEPQGAAAGVRAKPAESFHAVLTNTNGDTFELPAAWGNYRAAPPPPPAATAAPAEVQIAATDDSWRDGEAMPEPVAAAPAPKAPPPPRYQSNGEPEFHSPQPAAAAPDANKGNVHAFAEGDEPTVWDLVDFINPLQHIPLVNLVYRELTGDKIGALPQIVGGAVLGGPIGAVSAITNVMVQEATGKDLGGHVLAMFNGDSQPPADAPAAPPPRGRIEVVAPAPDAAAAPAPVAAPAVPAAPAHTATTGKFVPFAEAPADMLPTAQAAKGKPTAKFKPAPPRTTQTAPVSASALAAPASAPSPPPEAVKRAAAAQGLADSNHPLINPNPAPAEGDQVATETLSAPTPISPRRRAISASDSAQPQANPANTSDFVNKFMNAMDKYDKASRLAAVPAPPARRRTETE